MCERVWVGIDVGKSSHHACVVDEAGQVMFSQAVGNGQAGIESLILKVTAMAASARWALDMTSGTAALLIALLHAHDQRMRYVPGKLVNRMSGAFAGEGKTDAKDAKTIAETARLRSDLATITRPDSAAIRGAMVGSARRGRE